jgi:hypothetical protein
MKITLLRLAALLVSVLFAALLQPVHAVRADAGPKPTMKFTFVYETASPLTIVSGEQLECEAATCDDAQPLEELGPQRFTCTGDSCSSMAYGYSDYHRLRIRFSDGVTRESNVFTKKFYLANYRVTVREDDLWVEERLGLSNPLVLVLVAGLAGFLFVGVDVVALLVVIVLLILRAGHERATFATSRWLFIAIWMLALPMLIGGTFVRLTMPLTFFIEGLIAGIYAAWRKRSIVTLVSLVLLANVITQPVLWLILVAGGATTPVLSLALAEVFIWWIETMLLYLTQRKTWTFKETVGFSLLLNLISFGIGLLLPV